METNKWNDARVLGPFLLDAGLALLRSGASSDRVRSNMERLAAKGDYVVHLVVSSLSISLSLNDDEGHVLYNGTGSIKALGVNFKVISGISLLSWNVLEESVSFENAKAELATILALPHYNRWLLLFTVGLAGAAFCFTFGGGAFEMAMGFLATFFGLFCKQEMIKHAYNVYIITYVSAVVAGTFLGCVHLAFPNIKLDHAFSTCVLFLIPGVPLINSITDLIEGYTINGVARGVGALMHALAIAFGLVTALFIFNFI